MPTKSPAQKRLMEASAHNFGLCGSEQMLRDNPPLCIDRKTLRDEFAMFALNGLFVQPYNPDWQRVVSRQAYELADAMMEARKKHD